jgi:RTX calcium-binding nonapeptide repeat (4 copies)
MDDVTSSRSSGRARRFGALGVLFLTIVAVQLLLSAPAGATPYTGGFSPTIFDGGADLNGDAEVTGRDDSNAFYGDTSIIDGLLDCDAWGAGSSVGGGDPADDNAGLAGDGIIDGADDCTLIGVDGTMNGVTIAVVNGAFDVPDGALPTVFNAGDPDNADIGDSDFAWSAIGGRVDSNGNETITANDCHFGLVGVTVDVGLGDATDGYDVLGNTQSNTNPCGFANAPLAANNGLVDRNDDGVISGSDSCTNGCFFRHNLDRGVVQVEGAVQAGGGFSGGFSPFIVNGLADLNGNRVVTGRDDSNAFYGDTSIIDGALDCDAWTSDNDGSAGSGVIDAADDCTLIGYDGTANGKTIEVIDGEFQVGNGFLPTIFNAANPDNPDVGDSDFAWSAINGRVDSNGNEFIDPNDCHFGLIGLLNDSGLGDATDGADILGNNQANTDPCGFGAPAPEAADNGLVDWNSDHAITSADSCTNGCFFGHNLRNGLVQTLECPGFAGDPRNDVRGTAGPDTLVGTSGRDIICGLGGNDLLIGRGGNDLLIGGGSADVLRGGDGADKLRGGAGGDVLRGGSGPDRLSGGRGNDDLFGGRGNDLLLGGPGRDHMDGGRGTDRCRGGPGRDTDIRCERH